jgi:presenilin-like A22 family membrane protease
MKHSVKVTALLLIMFFITQLIGIFVVGQYAPEISQTIDEDGNIIDVKTYNLPYGMDPPEDIQPTYTVISIMIAIIIAVTLMFVLMRFNAELVLRLWFFAVVTLALGITLNSFAISKPYAPIIALAIALPIAYVKIFKRNLIVHNVTELAIYPGIASIFVPILSIWTVVLLLVLISLYDMYAVWHAGFMQKMAKYQIQKLKVFSGFFVPYIGHKQMEKIKKSKSSNKDKKVKVSVAILGGGDVVFPIILAGVVLMTLGFLPALMISIGATLALAGLFWLSDKGKFYPAMPFITLGCFAGLIVAYLI